MGTVTYNISNNNMHQQSDFLNYYLTMNVNNICRICLEKGPRLMPIFDPVKPPHFPLLIMACAAVQVLQGDGLPPYICQKCVSKLNIAFQFKTQCESSDAKLRQCFENFHHLPPTPDLSGFIELKKDDGNNLSIFTHNNDGGTDTTNILVSQQIPITSQLPSTELNDNLLESTEAHILVQMESAPSLYNIDQKSVVEVIPDGVETKTDFRIKADELSASKLDIGETETKKPRKEHQCGTCGKAFRIKTGLVHHIRIHTGERPYVCKLCGKRFVNGGHLHTHMRTHTGEKNHICAACSKAFATAQQLTKHTIAIHTSERPYACSYCPKRFASSSNLNTHTKIHTGEKNYHCDQCGKAFSTKGQLLQHMLVHTGEKAFLCEYCNKRFSQKAHLTRHLKTHQS